MDILSEMSSVYYELTTSEKRIAEYILDHTDEVQISCCQSASLRRRVTSEKLQLPASANGFTRADTRH